MYDRGGKDAWLPQLKTRQEGDKEGTQEEMEDGESRGAPELLFSLISDCLNVALKMTGCKYSLS